MAVTFEAPAGARLAGVPRPRHAPAIEDLAGPVITDFDPQYPSSPVDDLQFARQALAAHEPSLTQRFGPIVAWADRIATRRYRVMHGDVWEDPYGDIDERFDATRAMWLEDRSAERASIVARYGGRQMPPSAFESLKGLDARLDDLEGLMWERRHERPPSRAFISPYLLAPVRRAIKLEMTLGENEATRAAARDLAERRLVLSGPYLARKARAAYAAGSGLIARMVSRVTAFT